MDISNYRREFAAYNSALERERYRQHRNPQAESRLNLIYERYSDLWTLDAIKNLQHTWNETPAHLETERSGLRALIHAARIRHRETAAKEITEELMYCRSSARVNWNGASLPVECVPNLIAEESSIQARRELMARWLDALGSCRDLEVARLQHQRNAWQSSNSDNESNLQQDDIESHCAALHAVATSFLERTSSAYLTHLTRWATNNLPTIATRDLAYSDSLFFKRAKNFDGFFAAHEQVATYQAAMSNLGIRVERQDNIHLDQIGSPHREVPARCFCINPPHEVRLSVATAEGLPSFQEFFHEAGLAQHFGWSSADLAARHPEFIYAVDKATNEGFAELFETLFMNPGWLSEHRSLHSTQASKVSAFIALVKMHKVRACCAEVIYEAELISSPDPRAEHLAATYEALHTEATGFSYTADMHLHDLDNRAVRAASCLRAHAFAIGLDEHLRTRYGHRWWAGQRRATDELIDMWNTGSRYSVEELASLIGIGNLDYDLLADKLIQAMDGET